MHHLEYRSGCDGEYNYRNCYKGILAQTLIGVTNMEFSYLSAKKNSMQWCKMYHQEAVSWYIKWRKGRYW